MPPNCVKGSSTVVHQKVLSLALWPRCAKMASTCSLDKAPDGHLISIGGMPRWLCSAFASSLGPCPCQATGGCSGPRQNFDPQTRAAPAGHSAEWAAECVNLRSFSPGKYGQKRPYSYTNCCWPSPMMPAVAPIAMTGCCLAKGPRADFASPLDSAGALFDSSSLWCRLGRQQATKP